VFYGIRIAVHRLGVSRADGISIPRHCRAAVSVTLVCSLAFPERRIGLKATSASACESACKATSASACALRPDDDRSCGCTADPLRGSARGALQRMGTREYSRRTSADGYSGVLAAHSVP
jgi:hypothetical protein